ncbi:hypothetical protein ACHRV5_14665 [Flavobacterium sp. FlaQc-52]|jgi:hypothetical protein|uniref:hypothetical protein n=1 Tax=Flavobacterium sp. FlaQc-52 TaxID=3374185 RepID=UPI003756E9CF
MYIDYSNWQQKDFSLNSLYLDLNNPRLNYGDVVLTQSGIITFLIENESVFELAKEISEKGYFVGESPIICEENNKKIVLEGNRRTAALKILQDPTKYLTKKRAEILKENITKNNIDVTKKINCFISPNRLMANPLIYNRHKGDSLKKWKTGNQYSFLADMIYRDGLTLEEISNSLGLSSSQTIEPLKAINLFLEGKKILEEKNISISVKDFEFTNLERFYKDAEGKEFLGIDFNNVTGELIINIPDEEFRKRCTYIFEQILNTTAFSRDFGNKEQKKAYIESLNKNPNFDFTVETQLQNTKSFSAEKKIENESLKKVLNTKPNKNVSSAANFYYIDQEETLFFNDEKIDTLFIELKTLSKGKAYSFAILLRTYLEQLLFLYLTRKQLFDNVGQAVRTKKEAYNSKRIENLESYLKNNHDMQIDLNKDVVSGLLGFKVKEEFDNSSLGTMLEYTINHKLTDLLSKSEFRNQKNYLTSVKDGLDLAVHNIDFVIDKGHNIRAWKTLLKFFKALESDLNNLDLEEASE